jgi:hypothetical protein
MDFRHGASVTLLIDKEVAIDTDIIDARIESERVSIPPNISDNLHP